MVGEASPAGWQAVGFRALLCTFLDLLAKGKVGKQAHSCFLHLVPNRNQTEKQAHSEVCAWNTLKSHTLNNQISPYHRAKKKITYWLKAESRCWQPVATDGK